MMFEKDDDDIFDLSELIQLTNDLQQDMSDDTLVDANYKEDLDEFIDDVERDLNQLEIILDA